MMYKGLINKYRSRLPVSNNTKIIELGEGNTPLIKLQNIPKKIGFNGKIYVKYEGLNPTGSFKDRGMTMAVTKAYEEGSRAIICASTGNTSASAAAYAARVKIKSFVIIPEGKIAMGKLAQAIIFGASVIQIKGNFDDGMKLVKELAEHTPVTIVNSINPYRLAGQKTVSFEIVDELGYAPDYHALPVGNAGNISAHWLGYKEYYDDKIIDKLPIMLGYQAQGAAPFVAGKMIDNPETIATAIRIGHPQSYDKAIKVKKESGGWFKSCSDDEILAAQKMLAANEGIFCEPASAISIAGIIKDIKAKNIQQGTTILCTLTGNGLKDPDIAIKQCGSAIKSVRADLSAIKNAILTSS